MPILYVTRPAPLHCKMHERVFFFLTKKELHKSHLPNRIADFWSYFTMEWAIAEMKTVNLGDERLIRD